jgi:polyisoprenyl-teichoic acid--peptidoglycan teichoic acid transferase
MITRYKKFNPDASGGRGFPDDPPREAPRPTKGQYAAEIALFSVFGILLVLAVIALYTTNSPSYKTVPNLVDQGMKQDRINILVFGVGGDRHPSADQHADAIMLISLKPSTGQVAVVSVPRDLWVHVSSFGMHRLNYAHFVGSQSGYPGGGPGLLADTVARIFNQPVHAFVRVDFAAFEKLIDAVGGVDVYCQRPFHDFLFNDGFQKGWLHLDGKRALAYARYRYINGPEGDNFARELRQQQVVNAFRDKLQHASPQTVMHLIAAVPSLSGYTKTNLTTAQMIELYRRFRGVDPRNIRHVSLKPLTEVFEVTRITEPGQAVRPRAEDDRELQRLEQTIFSSERPVTTDDQIRFASAPAAPRQKTFNAAD